MARGPSVSHDWRAALVETAVMTPERIAELRRMSAPDGDEPSLIARECLDEIERMRARKKCLDCGKVNKVSGYNRNGQSICGTCDNCGYVEPLYLDGAPWEPTK
jgi:hypothetical protein